MNQYCGKINNLFLVGAGFDRAVFGEDAPLNEELFGKLIDYARKERMPIEHDLLRLRENYHTSEIEKILTYLDIEEQTDEGQLRSKIDGLLVQYFEQFNFRQSVIEKHAWLRTFANVILKENDVIIDINYNTLIGGLLDWYDVWSPNGGFGSHVYNPMPSMSNVPRIPDNATERKNILWYKIHGAVNFQLSGNDDFKYIQPVLSRKYFPRSCSHTEFGGGIPVIGHYVIAPSYVKVPHVQLEYLFLDMLRKIQHAKKLVIIGCSLRPEDGNLWLLLAHFLPPRYKEYDSKKLIIIDPKVDNVKEAIRKHFYSSICGFFDTEYFFPIPDGLCDKGIEKLKDALKN